MNMEKIKWQAIQLRDVLKIGNGKDYKHLQKGDVPVYGTGGVMTYVNDYLYDGETVCIGRKGTIDKPIYHIGKIWTVDTLFYTHSFVGVVPHFLYYEFCNINWNKYNEATGVPSLSKETIYKIDIPIPVTSSGKPSLPTQRRIVEILSSVDKVIDSTEALIKKYKAIKMGLLDDLLQPKEGWQKTTLGKIGKISMCKRIFSFETTSSGDIPFYKIGTFGKKADAFISKQLYEEYKSKFSYPKVGDILISASGTIGRTVVYDGKPAYFQDSNIIWIDNDEKVVLNQFLLYLYKTITWNLEGSTIARLYNDNFNRIEISYPDYAEQQRISLVLQSVDAKITSEQKTLEKYRNLKKGLMKDLFKGK